MKKSNLHTERERALCILNGKQPDQVPWFGDLAYWLPYADSRGILRKDHYGEGVIQLHRELGVGFYLQGYFPFREGLDISISLREDRNGNEIRYTYTTPVGAISQLTTLLPESFTAAVREHFVKTAEDLKVLMYIYEHTKYEPDYALAVSRARLVEDIGLVLCYLPKSPLMELVAYKAGIEAVVEIEADEPELFAEALDVIGRAHDKAAGIALESPAECLMIPENLSSEVVGKRLFNTYMREYETKWNKRINEAGKYSFVHMDGTMRGLIKETASTGFRVMEALTTAPVGDIPLKDLSDWVEDDTIIWGGLPGVYFSDSVSDLDFDAYVREALEIMKTSPRYVLGVADQVPPGTRTERIVRVRALVDEYGRY